MGQRELCLEITSSSSHQCEYGLGTITSILSYCKCSIEFLTRCVWQMPWALAILTFMTCVLFQMLVSMMQLLRALINFTVLHLYVNLFHSFIHSRIYIAPHQGNCSEVLPSLA